METKKTSDENADSNYGSRTGKHSDDVQSSRGTRHTGKSDFDEDTPASRTGNTSDGSQGSASRGRSSTADE